MTLDWRTSAFFADHDHQTDSTINHITSRLFAIEPAIRPHPNPGDADYENAKYYSGNQSLSEPIASPQTKQGGAHRGYAK